MLELPWAENCSASVYVREMRQEWNVGMKFCVVGRVIGTSI